MNSTLASIMENNTPKFTKKVVEGNAKERLETMPRYLDLIFRSSLKSLNPKVKLNYLGYRKCTPEEEFQKMVLTDTGKAQYDIASSDIYLVEYQFEYGGKTFSRYIYLPYADDANIIHISGTKYHIVPVLSDTVISPSHKELFVRLLKNKLIFKSHLRDFVKDGKRDELMAYLKEKDIGTIIHYPIPPHLSEAYQSLGYHKGDLPIAEAYADEVLSIPMYNGMTEEEQTYVIGALNAFRP